MEFLLKSPHKFIFWWAIAAPKRIGLIIKRLIVLVNSKISFTINLKLFFTPLFGDYSPIGRFVGFVFRITELFFGLAVIGFLFIMLLAAPVLWWLSPLFMYEYTKFWILPILLIIYIVWSITTKNNPENKVTEVTENNCLDSYRPETKVYLDNISKEQSHGLLSFTKDPKIVELLERSELNTRDFIEKIISAPKQDTDQLVKLAYEYAKNNLCRYVENEHLFTAFLNLTPKRDLILSTYNNKLETVEKASEWIVAERERVAKLYIWNEDFNTMFTGGFGKGMTGKVTPFLDSISEDFTKEAQRGTFQRYIVLENEIKKIGEILSNSAENILIIGEPGSGKTSLVRGMAYKIIEGIEYKSLSNKRIVSLDLTGVFGGTKSIGEISEKLSRAIDEASSSGDVIIFIDEIHNLLAGDSGQNPEVASVYSILSPHMESGKIQFIAATNIQNYRKYIEPNGAFSRLFNIVEIPEASKESTIKILEFNARELEKRYKITITYPALEKTVDLSKKLIQERVLPDKAIKILDRAATSVPHNNGQQKVLNTQVILREISEVTKVPVDAISSDESEKLLQIEDEMRKMVVGQDHAIKQVAMALKRGRAGVRNENKPIASFLFIGTTGVGKTQTAKALAKTYFGDPKAMIRLDMSEYQQIDSINRLIGTPDGKNQGMLSGTVRSKPFSLILLDEIEKAHPSILMVFLQILDEGTATDSSGLKIDFTNTIIIATSNVGTRTIQDLFSKNADMEQMREGAMSDVRNNFSPELLNRFSGIIVFNPLTMESVRKIVILLLNDVSLNTQEKGIKVSFKDELILEIMKRGYNPEWGARPLTRVIEDTVETYLATKILEKNLQPGDDIELGTEILT